MVGNNEVLERVERRAKEAEEMVELLKEQLACLERAIGKRFLDFSFVHMFL